MANLNSIPSYSTSYELPNFGSLIFTYLHHSDSTAVKDADRFWMNTMEMIVSYRVEQSLVPHGAQSVRTIDHVMLIGDSDLSHSLCFCPSSIGWARTI
jgi:hypothetical protein